MELFPGLWRLADPKISAASMASIFLGACAAAWRGPMRAGWLALTVAGIFFLEVAKNASGEIFDFDSGADQGVAPRDRSPFSGGKRVLVDGLLSRAQTAAIASAGYALGIAGGLVIVALREPRVLWLGLAGVAAAWFYHAPPVKLSYRGFGEAAVGVVYGPLIASGTYLVQRGELPWDVLLLAAPMGLLVAAFLWINEFPDFNADKAAGKRNLVVRLGRTKAASVFSMIISLALLTQICLPLMGFPRAVWLGGLSAVPALAAARRLSQAPEDTAHVIPAQSWTLLAFLLASLGAGLGLLAS